MTDYFTSGFCVRVPSWHGKENLLEDWPGSWAEAAPKAGLDWDIRPQDVYVGAIGKQAYGVGPKGDFFPDVQLSLVEGWKAITRDDNGAVLDITPPSYEPLSNAEFGEIVETVIAQLGMKAEYETLVVLRGGRLIAVTLRGPERAVPGDDSPLLPYIAGWTSHDRSAACKLGATQVRVVCANTQTMADLDMDSRGSGFVIQHRSGLKDRLAEVATQLQRVFDAHDQMYDRAVELAGLPITRQQVEEFVDYWIPTSTDMSARRLENVMESRARFWDVYDGPAGEKTMAGIRDNAWGLYCAATETADWFTPFRSRDTLIHRQLLGGDRRKSGALAAIARVTS